MSAPYYDDGTVRIWHGDWREHLDWRSAAVLVTDPPYGIGYDSNQPHALRHDGELIMARSIAGDNDTAERDAMLRCWGAGPALLFGSWRAPRPAGTRMLLVWDTKGANGMGALDLPWKPAHQEIYVIGSGFSGRRTSDVLRFAPVQARAVAGRVHPHQKPTDLMQELIQKCPPGEVADPFCGSGSTLVAAKALGRPAVGVEVEERYCELAALRCSQGVLPLCYTPGAR